jgi:hypothetical protein
MDVLSQYQNSPNRPPPEVMQDFQVVADEAEPEDIGVGLEEAFRSEQTPPFEQMVSQLFSNSNAHQRAGLLNLLGPRISPEEAQQVAPGDVESLAAEAAQRNPSIMQRVSRFYAEHPALVQSLGQAALAIAMNTMARRRRM